MPLSISILCFLSFQFIIIWCISGFLLAIFTTVLEPIFIIILYILSQELTLFLQDLYRVSTEDKCVLITGCDSGFGFMLTKSLSKKGILVFAGVLSECSAGAETLRTLPGVKVIQMDVTSDHQVNDAKRFIEEELNKNKKKLWAVVNNAGIGYSQFLEFTTITKLYNMLEVNTLGMLRVSQTFAPLLRGHGRLVNVTSKAGTLAVPSLGAYSMTKFAAEGLSKCLRIEWHPLGIDVITIQPLSYRTEMINKVHYTPGCEEVAVYGEEFIKKYIRRINTFEKRSNPNIMEVVNSLESALLNKYFQYNYTPGFKYRLFNMKLEMSSESYIVKTGCFGLLPNKIPS